MNIIIVDDDRKAAETLKYKLEEYDGIEVIGMAYNGMDGLRLYNDSKPDVMFLDVDMPDISGIEFLERIEMNIGSRCRVVMYTAYSRYMLSAFRNKAFDYLMKPINDTELRTIIRRVCIDMSTEQPRTPSTPAAPAAPTFIGDGIARRNDGKYIVYTNAVDFRLVDINDIGFFAYNSDLRVWEVTLAGEKHPIRLKRNINSDMLLALNDTLVRVSQKHIINIAYLMEVADNTCHFYPPFDALQEVKVGRLFRKKLIDRFSSF